MGGVSYRLGQFWRILTARPLPTAARMEIAAALTPPEVALFERLAASDQWHSWRVMQTLQAAGHDQPDLLAAALLHDVGKTRWPLTLWDRTLIVLAQAIWPKWVAVWGEPGGRGWRRPFVVKAQHPIWGAEMAAAAGSRPLTIALIRRHQDLRPAEPRSEADRLLGYLQWADDQN
ncbi:MAG: HD domain-containing protein [Chloroflexota bacterium]